MEHSQSKTPCRTVGLRRIARASKPQEKITPAGSSGSSFSSPETPKTCVGLCSVPIKSSKRLRRSSPDSLERAEDITAPLELNQEPGPADSLSRGKIGSLFKNPSDPEDVLNTNHSEPNTGISKIPKLDLSRIPTLQDLHALQKRVALKERQLKELRQADVICKKHNPDNLKDDIQHWLRACQEGLQVMLSSANKNGSLTDMVQLLNELGIPPSLVHYDVETDEFE